MTDVAPIPLYVELEDGLDEMKGHKKSKSYITAMMNTYVKNTPFKQMQIVDLHQKIQQQIPSEVNYSSSTISRQLRRLRKEGQVLIFDEHEEDLPQNRLFVWAPSVPEFVEHSEQKAEEDKKKEQDSSPPPLVPSIQENTSLNKSRTRKRNPATPFFKAIFQKILGTT